MQLRVMTLWMTKYLHFLIFLSSSFTDQEDGGDIRVQILAKGTCPLLKPLNSFVLPAPTDIEQHFTDKPEKAAAGAISIN